MSGADSPTGALVSIHDVTPETLPRVETILELLAAKDVGPASLLVVPGKPWEPDQIDRLRELAGAGHVLAAHGWCHRAKPRSLYHRLHGLVISRDSAEHLALDSRGILDLLNRSRDWFAAHRLPLPDLYVPPAWALGPIRAADVDRAPFRVIETTRGLLRPRETGKRRREILPLAGFEADTPLREQFLRRWNNHQLRRARRTGRPLRLSIHPDDLDLRLRNQLKAFLDRKWRCLRYTD